MSACVTRGLGEKTARPPTPPPSIDDDDDGENGNDNVGRWIALGVLSVAAICVCFVVLGICFFLVREHRHTHRHRHRRQKKREQSYLAGEQEMFF